MVTARGKTSTNPSCTDLSQNPWNDDAFALGRMSFSQVARTRSYAVLACPDHWERLSRIERVLPSGSSSGWKMLTTPFTGSASIHDSSGWWSGQTKWARDAKSSARSEKLTTSRTFAIASASDSDTGRFCVRSVPATNSAATVPADNSSSNFRTSASLPCFCRLGRSTSRVFP